MLETTKVGCNINRHYYSIDEIENAVKSTIVKKLIDLIEFRNNHPTLNGEFELVETEDDKIHIRRIYMEHTAELIAEFTTRKFEIKSSDC